MLGFEAPDTGEIDVEEDFKKVEFYLQNSKNLIYQYLKKKLLTLKIRHSEKYRVQIPITSILE